MRSRIPKKRPTNLTRSSLVAGSGRKETERGQTSAFPSDTFQFAPLILAHRGSALPWLFDDRAAFHLRQIWCVPTRGSATRLCATVPPAFRVPPPPQGHQTRARKRRAPGNTIPKQTYRRRVLTDRLNLEDSQLAAPLEVDPGPTPAGKTLPHSFPIPRFQRKRA